MVAPGYTNPVQTDQIRARAESPDAVSAKAPRDRATLAVVVDGSSGDYR